MKKFTINGAAGSAGTNQIFATVQVINDVRTIVSFDFLDSVLRDGCARTLQKKIVKLNTVARIKSRYMAKLNAALKAKK